MRLVEVIQRSTAYLAERGVESPRLQVEWMLSHTLRIPRLQLYLEFDRDVGEDDLAALREVVRRRGRREPLQYVLGTTSFCGLEFEVTAAALIPRPETELLAERGWTWLAEHRPASGALAQALDWGTGTGCLAIAVAQHAPQTHFTALDTSLPALALARRNAIRHGCSEQITFIQGNGCAALAPGMRFDLILGNPPYIPSGELPSLSPEVRDYEPRTALDGGPDGLAFFRQVAGECSHRLNPHGCVLLEFGDGQAQAVTDILQQAHLIVAERHRDYSGRERFLVARRDS